MFSAENPSHGTGDPSQPGLVAKAKTVGSPEIHAAIERLAAAISARHPAPQPLLILGIAAGGIELARRLALSLSRGEPPASMRARPGIIDISFHRDDTGLNPIPKEYPATMTPGDVHGATVILTDDVLFSGRTVKAALDELFDHGRAETVELAVLVDRGGRALPIAATYTGLTIATGPTEKIVVRLDPTNPAKDSIQFKTA
ncbi:MAG: hypothetical protein RL324_762 [Verrucomicrobiota bacterium]